jgi:hypothetical protein
MPGWYVQVDKDLVASRARFTEDGIGIRQQTLRVIKVASRGAPEPKPYQGTKTAHSVVFAAMMIFLLPFSAQKSHVKPPNDLTSDRAITSAWHVS